MITKLEALDTIAVKNGYQDWIHAGFFKEPIELTPLIEEAMEYYAEQSNSHKPVVSGKQLDYKTIRAAAIDHMNEMWKKDAHEPLKNYCLNDFLAGAQWYRSQVACASGAVDKTVSDGNCFCKQWTGYKGECTCSNGMPEP